MPVVLHHCTVFQIPAQTVCNTINCVGAMGRGLALAFKNRHPDMYREYVVLCREKKIRPGILWLWKNSLSPEYSWVLNFPTKDNWWGDSQLAWVEEGLQKLASRYADMGITSINIPPLGCSNGGLSIEVVSGLIYKYLDPLPITVNYCIANYRDWVRGNIPAT